MTSGLTANYAEVGNTRPDPWTSYEDAFDACEDGGHAAVVSATGNCASVVYSGACSSDDTLCYNNAAVSSISSAFWATFAHEVTFTPKPHHPRTNFPFTLALMCKRKHSTRTKARARANVRAPTMQPSLAHRSDTISVVFTRTGKAVELRSVRAATPPRDHHRALAGLVMAA